MFWARFLSAFTLLSPQQEARLVSRLVDNKNFGKLAREAHRRVHKLKTGEELPREVDPTHIEGEVSKTGQYWRHFKEEISNQIKGLQPRKRG